MRFVKLLALVALIAAVFVVLNPQVLSRSSEHVKEVDEKTRQAFADIDKTYGEIKEELAAGKNLIHFNRISGLLTDLIREHKKIFLEKYGAQRDETANQLEALINEAGMFASEDKYDECFKVFEEALETVTRSLKEMHAGSKKVQQ